MTTTTSTVSDTVNDRTLAARSRGRSTAGSRGSSRPLWKIGRTLCVGAALMVSVFAGTEANAVNVDVTATGGTLNASYTTLTAAFAAVNAGTHTGTITMGISANTNEGTGTAVLNASGSGSASYTTITISPTGGAARTITGATTAGSPLIDLNGADNVTIDG